MRRIFEGITAGALVVVLIGMVALPYFPHYDTSIEEFRGNDSYWQFSLRGDIILTVLIVAAIGILVFGIVRDVRWPAIVSAPVSAFALASVFFLDYPSYSNLPFGFWALSAFCLIAVGTSLVAALLHEPSGSDHSPGRSAANFARPAQPMQEIPVGWYPDPAGSGGMRLWSGTDWTDETRDA